MNEEDLKHYNVYGETEADRFILNEMLKMLFLYDGFDFYGECQKAKMYKSEADNVKRWHWHNNNPPHNDIYRLLGHLQYEYEPEYRIALQKYIKSNSSS